VDRCTLEVIAVPAGQKELPVEERQPNDERDDEGDRDRLIPGGWRASIFVRGHPIHRERETHIEHTQTRTQTDTPAIPDGWGVSIFVRGASCVYCMHYNSTHTDTHIATRTHTDTDTDRHIRNT